MRLLDRYIANTVLQTAAVMMAVAAALSVVSTFLTEAEEVAAGEYGVLALLFYIALKLPEHLHEVMPIIALLGALLALGGLAAGSELVVIRSAGVSIARLAWAVARAGLVLALLTIVLGEWLGPSAVETLETGHRQPTGNIQRIGDGLWLREGERTIRIEGTLAEDILAQVSIYRGGTNLQSVLSAETARYQDGSWHLENVAETRFGDDRVVVARHDRLAWDVDLRPEFLRFAVVKAEELSSLGLYRYSNYLRANDVAAAGYRLAMWRNLAAPVTVLVLTVLALPFAFGALRSAGAGQRLFAGGLAGLSFFVVNEIAVSSGQVYGLPPWLAATWPTALLAAGAGWWLWRLR